MTLAPIHRWLDQADRPTYVYERAAFLLLELTLLIACAVPVVTGWRSFWLTVLVGALRLHEAELRREDASVMGRHAEHGGVSPLPSVKRAQAARRARALDLVSWTWPSMTTVIMAADQRAPVAAVVIALGACITRTLWGRAVMPAWRRSRVAWGNAHAAPRLLQPTQDELLVLATELRAHHAYGTCTVDDEAGRILDRLFESEDPLERRRQVYR